MIILEIDDGRIRNVYTGESLATIKEELLSKSPKSRKLAPIPLEETLEQSPEAPAEPEAMQVAKEEVSRKKMKI